MDDKIISKIMAEVDFDSWTARLIVSVALAELANQMQIDKDRLVKQYGLVFIDSLDYYHE